MGVYISNMEMPTSSRRCPFTEMDDWGMRCIIGGKYEWHKDRLCDECPLVPVPPHGRLIDASEKIKVQIYDDMTEDYHMVEMTIDDLLCQGWVEANAPTIIEAEEGEI